jgi:glycosyltransferase involved in cell wall biosynthesis
VAPRLGVHINFVTEMDCQAAARTYPKVEKRLWHTVRNGISDHFRCPRPAGLHRPEGFLICFVGDINPSKGIFLVLRSFALLRERGFNAHLWLVGKGRWWDPVQEEIRQRKLEPYVTMWGYVPYAEHLIALSDVLVLASVTEGLPKVILEANRCGVPAVAAPVGGIPALVMDGRTGFLVEQRTPEAYADALRKLAGNEEDRKRMGLAARDFVLDSYGAERMYRDYLRVYETAIDTAARRAGGP